MTIKFIDKDDPNQKHIIDLDGPEGNAWGLMANFSHILKQSKMPEERIDELLQKMRSGDYTNLVCIFNRYLGSVIELQTSQKQLFEAIRESEKADEIALMFVNGAKPEEVLAKYPAEEA